MDIIAAHGTTFLAIAVIFGLFMTWGIGANDVHRLDTLALLWRTR